MTNPLPPGPPCPLVSPRGATTKLTMGSKLAPTPPPACESDRKPMLMADPACLPFPAPFPGPFPGGASRGLGQWACDHHHLFYLICSRWLLATATRCGPGPLAMTQFSGKEMEAQEHLACYGSMGLQAQSPSLQLWIFYPNSSLQPEKGGWGWGAAPAPPPPNLGVWGGRAIRLGPCRAVIRRENPTEGVAPPAHPHPITCVLGKDSPC